MRDEHLPFRHSVMFGDTNSDDPEIEYGHYVIRDQGIDLSIKRRDCDSTKFGRSDSAAITRVMDAFVEEIRQTQHNWMSSTI